MSRPIHPAYVEERVDESGDRYFVATCAETLIQCDAFAFPDLRLGVGIPNGDDQAVARALAYLGDGNLHDRLSARFCDADHVHAEER